MKKISDMVPSDLTKKLKVSGKVNSMVYYLWAIWAIVTPMIVWTQVNWQCVDTDRSWVCTYTPSNVNMNWHYSTQVSCNSWDCGATCNVSISEIVNWLLTKSYQCNYHVNHASSGDSGSWSWWDWWWDWWW